MSPEGLAQLKLDEGCRLHAYPDPLSGGDPWTIGYGCTGPKIKKGVVWTQLQADNEVERRVAGFERDLDEHLPWWRMIGAVRSEVLSNMCFNLGVRGLLGFHNTLAHIEQHHWEQAAAGMLASAWAKQTGRRAKRLAEMMRTGKRPQ